uniref:Signal recognition particle 19 kDa protein n=1 Tax=Nomascus leucogenys TaxID=61853 RepID=A0A2I3HED0_NOMLE
MACTAMQFPAKQDRFICIYPAYLNNKKTITEGSKAVENPTKNKMYSRKWNRDVQYRGRVRVHLKQEDGSLCLIQFPSCKSVMLYAAEIIPKLKRRTQKIGGGDQSLQQGEGSKKGKRKKKK